MTPTRDVLPKRLLWSSAQLITYTSLMGFTYLEARQSETYTGQISDQGITSTILHTEESATSSPTLPDSSTDLFLWSASTSSSEQSSSASYTSPPDTITKTVDITADSYPSTAAQVYVWAGNENNGSVEEGDATENTHLIINGGHATAAYGGNYGNAGGASFTGDSYVEVLTDTVTFIAGASRLTHDVSSTFDGSTHVTVRSTLNANTNSATSYVNIGYVIGGFHGKVESGSSDGVQRNNTITGSTNLVLDLAGETGAFENGIVGGSMIYGGVDSRIEQSANLTITNAEGVTFGEYVVTGDYNYSPVASSLPEANEGVNNSDSYVRDHRLTIDSGTFTTEVIGSSFNAAGGDVISESSTVNITGGTFQGFVIAGHASAKIHRDTVNVDLSSGALQLGDVVMNLSGADFQARVVGGHFVSQYITHYDSELDNFIGDITLNIGGYDEAGQALGGSYLDIFGGTNNCADTEAIHVEQGAVVINLETGSIKDKGNVVAGGFTYQQGTLTGESTSVNISSEFGFGADVDVYGSIFNVHSDSAGIITGVKQLAFDDAQYDNLGDTTTFYDFDEVHVEQASAHADLEGKTTLVTLDSEHLTKTGAGSAEVEAGDGRGVVLVKEGTMQINTQRSTTGTADELRIESAGHVVTERLTIARDQIAAAGLSVNDVTGSGLIEAQQMVVKQEWKQSGLSAIAHESFTMITGDDVHLEALRTTSLYMDDSAHLHVEGLLEASYISIDEYAPMAGASSPYITAADMTSAADNVFTFDFSSMSIANMELTPEIPYLVADLGEGAFATADSKSFVFQIDGVGTEHTQVINGTTYYLGTMGADVYIYAFPGEVVIPEPTTATLSVMALAGLLARRRRRQPRV